MFNLHTTICTKPPKTRKTDRETGLFLGKDLAFGAGSGHMAAGFLVPLAHRGRIPAWACRRSTASSSTVTRMMVGSLGIWYITGISSFSIITAQAAGPALTLDGLAGHSPESLLGEFQGHTVHLEQGSDTA